MIFVPESSTCRAISRVDIEGVERHDDAAGFQHGIISDDEIGRIGQAKPHARTVDDADLLEATRGAVNETPQFRVG